MTLLILDLNVSAIGRAINSDQLWHGLYDLRSSIVSFAISFLMLGSLWAVHTRQFEYIKRSNRHLIMINNIRLLAVVLLPLTTSIAGAYSNLVLGNILLPINFLIIILISTWQWQYAVNSKPKLYDFELTEPNKRYFKLRNNLVIATSVGVVILSLFIGEWAFALFILPPIITRRMAKILDIPDSEEYSDQ